MFRDQNCIRRARHARVQGDPTGIPAHHLHHHHPSVRSRRGVQAVKCFGGESHGSIEAEGHIRFIEVVIDCFGHRDHSQPAFRKYAGDRQRPIATHRDQRIDGVQAEPAHDLIAAIDFLCGAIGMHDWVLQRILAIARPQDRAAQVRDATDAFARQRDEPTVRVFLRRQNAVKTVAHTVHFPAAFHRR